MHLDNKTVLSNSAYEILLTDEGIKACYYKEDGVPLSTALTISLPTFILQLSLVVLVSRFLILILRPLKQPYVVAYILAGIILGQPELGSIPVFVKYVITLKSIKVMETFANLALVYYMFLVGLEVNLQSIMHCGKMAVRVAISGMLFPLATGLGLYFLLSHFSSEPSDVRGSMFWAVAFTASSFPDVAVILADLKLLHSDIGKLALSSSIISDFCTLVLLIFTLSIVNPQTFHTILSTMLFVFICIIVIRPLISSLISQTITGDDIKDSHVYFILGWVIFFGLVTDACGVHSFVGGFMFGIIMPPEEMITTKLTEKIEELVSGIMLPLFFLTTGLRTDLNFMLRTSPVFVLVLVVAISFVAKIIGTLFVSFFFDLKLRESVTLGLLMNTKGVIPFIVINSGRNIKALGHHNFAIIALSLVFMTALTGPIIAATYKTQRHVMQYKNRTIESVFRPGTQFNVLACVHSMSDVPGMISLLESSNASKHYPIRLVGVHLSELTRRATAMLVVNDKVNRDAYNTVGSTKSESDLIIDAFKSCEYRTEGVTVETIAIVSSYRTMHEDICNLAQDKCACLVILPYYRSLNAEGRVEEVNSTLRDMSRGVLDHAPCSVGLLVDRGSSCQEQRVLMPFIGGPDDREALTYAWRMSGRPSLSLTVLRFLPGTTPKNSPNPRDHAESIIMSTEESQKRLDEEYTYEFMWKAMDDESINYVETVVNNGAETLAAIRQQGPHYNLYITGKAHQMRSPVLSGLSDWSATPELGVIGHTLASASFASQASILVVQQYADKTRDQSERGVDASYDDGSSPLHPLRGNYRNSFESKILHYDHDSDEDDVP